ncbi:FG-GAP and VCBS repeat-containing protein [Streptomyces sp. NPDC058371]|uniref:FG-GAP and VCBS repeat-containing protein n=1 Tax=Streptomyces sp. NPDC058371 TaxID=3346463 RepID=UPI003649496B
MIRLRAVLTCAVVLAATTGCGGDEPAPRHPTAGKPADRPDPGDFNGDGYDDFLGFAQSAPKNGIMGTSTLVVVYGSKNGLNPAWATRVRPARGQEFGAPPLRADLDKDGFTDLIAGRGTDLAETRTFAMFGGPRGLGAARLLDLPTGFRPLAAADFDGDGSVDLLDGGRGRNGGEPGTDGALLYGPFDRTGTPRRQVALDLRQHGTVTPRSAVTGDFDGDHRAEVVLTYSFDAEQDEAAPSGLYTVGYYEGGERGLVRDTRQESRISRAVSTPGGPRTPAVGDADGDGTDDLLMPTRLIVAPADLPKTGGALTILYGARSGLGTGRRETVIGNRDTDQRRVDFGASPAVGDVNGDHRPDVVVDTPDFRRHDGRVTLLPGGPDGVPSAAGEQSVDAGTKGLPGTPNPYYWNAFNHQPPLLDVDGDGHADAVVFAPLYEKRKGAFLVLRGTDAGFDPKRAQLFTPDDLGTAQRLP